MLLGKLPVTCALGRETGHMTRTGVPWKDLPRPTLPGEPAAIPFFALLIRKAAASLQASAIVLVSAGLLKFLVLILFH